MDVRLTAVLMLLAALLAGFSLWGVRRRRTIGEVSYIPWHGLLFVGILAFCTLTAHLITLLTGVPMPGRGY